VDSLDWDFFSILHGRRNEFFGSIGGINGGI
jgi:hypothetical protein